jgi:hypothetical protein
LRLDEIKTERFLFTVQGIGIVFVGIFLAAYLAGLPSTNVLHSEPALRIPLAISGVALLGLALATIVFAAFSEKDRV